MDHRVVMFAIEWIDPGPAALVAPQAEPGRHGIIAEVAQQHADQPKTPQRRRNGCQRVANIVLTVPKAPNAIFPGLTPVNR